VGFLWGLWHFPLFSASRSSSGSVSPTLYLCVLLFSFLPAYRVLMVWVYDRTGSLLVAMLMHGPLAANQLILMPLALSGMPLVTYDIVFAAALWIVVAAVAVANRGQPRDNRSGGGWLERGSPPSAAPKTLDTEIGRVST